MSKMASLDKSSRVHRCFSACHPKRQLSPPDIEYAARRALQAALENAVDKAGEQPGGPFMKDYTQAISSTRATVSAQVSAEFTEDISTVGRV